jgi:hypothetical protein
LVEVKHENDVVLDRGVFPVTLERVSITAKIWLSLGIFMAGMVLSTILSQALGLSAEAALRVTVSALFPSVQQSERAEKSFERTIKTFSDAVLVQDAEKLDDAATSGRDVVTALRTITTTQGLSTERKAEAERIVSAMSQFLTEAQATYAQAVNSRQMSPELQARVGALASRTAAMRTSLSQLTERGAADLRDHLSDLPVRSRTQRWLALLVAIATLLVAGAFSSYMIGATNKSLRTALDSLSAGSMQVASAAGQLAASSQALSTGANEQARALQETSSSMAEMASTTRNNREGAVQASTLVNTVTRQMDESTVALDQMIGSMAGIKDSSDKVARIIKTIDEIAFQTNILALNAAVEAARAGEAGAGFAVVAGEVRSLALRSAQSARDTATLIEESTLRSLEGTTKVAEVASAIAATAANMTRLKTIVENVQSGSEQQALGIDRVTQTVAQIERVTQATAANSEESAAASEQLNAHAESTLGIVQKLAFLVGGTPFSAPPAIDHGFPAPATPRRRERTTPVTRVVRSDTSRYRPHTSDAALQGAEG